MGTRETLRQRPDVPNADIEQIIEVAARLQDEDRDAAAAPTVAEMEAVAAELDIAPAYIEAAIGRIREDRDALAAAEAAATAQRARTLRVGGLAAAVLAGILVFFAMTGAMTLGSYRADVRQAEAALVAVLDRQAGLAPQLTALAGARVDLSAELDSVRAATDVDAKLAAVEALNTRMGAALAQVPASNPARLDLHHEITGGWNRVTVERRRLAEAEAAVESVSWRPDVALARMIGF